MPPNTDSALYRRIASVFQLNGLTIRKEACNFLVENLLPLSVTEREEWLDKITEYCMKQQLSSNFIEKEVVESAIIDSCKGQRDDEEELLTVISAFDVQRFSYNAERKKFLLDETPRELFAPASSKGRLFRDRYTLLYQRTLRNKLFHGVANDTSQFKLRPVEFLLSTNFKIDNVVILGMLTQLKEGRYHIEDPTGIVQLDLSNTTYHDGLFADSCFVLAEGSYIDGVLSVQAMGLPPRESAEVSRVYFGPADPFGGLQERSKERLLRLEMTREEMIVIISDCWLDDPKVLNKLKTLFTGYSDSPPKAFILMGNFLSRQNGSKQMLMLKDAFKSLGEIITPEIGKSSKFIIIPGPTDSPAANILPKPGLPQILIEGLQRNIKNLILATNPCRIRYCTQEIVIIREDLATKLCRNSIHFPSGKDIGSHFAKTLICQASLVPLSLNVCPVYWDFDSALQLYPTPNLIIVGDQQKAFSVSYNNCHVINPGPFLKGEFAFKVYYPATREVEDCQIPQEE